MRLTKTDKKPDSKSQSSNGDSPFMSRWSRRKQKVRAEHPGEGKADDGEKQSEDNLSGPGIPLNSIVSDGVSGRMQTRTAVDQLAEECADAGDDAGIAPLTDDDMPALDSLDESSDFSGFMSSGVSDRLRKQALRKLFSSAGFNVRDGLDDYDEDFTNFEGLGDIVTSDMKHREEVAAEKRKETELAEQETEQSGEQIAETEDPDSVAAGDDSEPLDDAEQAVDKEQKSVTLAEDDPDVAGKPPSKKSS